MPTSRKKNANTGSATREPVDVMSLFQPSVRKWFESQFPEPTAVQKASWPQIEAGKHVLITAPTGSGKTLTAFLWSLNRFASGQWQPGKTRVIYISPLKALNNDIARNLLVPLEQLAKEEDFPSIQVRTRSGDTSQSDRQRMLRNPPDILITTPESLGLLMTTTKGQQALSTVETIVLDEIHSIVDNRRGVSLMTTLERITHLKGEFQRIALSATVNPLEAVANYVGGYLPDGTPRPVKIINAAQEKKLQLRVCFPEAAKLAVANGQKIWDPLADSFRDLIESNQSTLFFANSRRLAEKITLKINEEQLVPLAYAHHGSLSREIRAEVESRLKQGELKAIVATNSLEMGIDIGSLDEVVMVQSPGSVASALQRIGRAGHQVGAVSRGAIFPSHAQDFLEAAVLSQAVADRDIEPLRLMENPLDVLAQIIIAMCGSESWPVEQMFALIRRAEPYHSLPREQFDLLIEMLAGRYAGSRVRELKPRISFDRINQTVKANRGAVLALYNSGGTIPDRGYYKLRHADSGALIGELDEEFVWEATTGQNFTLGTQNWQIQRITHNDVLVRAAKPSATAPPFWRSEVFNRSYHFSKRLVQFLEMSDATLAKKQESQLRDQLVAKQGFDECAATELVEYLTKQRHASRSALPHRHHMLLELVHSGPAGYKGPDAPKQLVIHSLWGGCINRPWALALGTAWRDKYQTPVEIHADNNAIVLQIKHATDGADVLSLVTPQNLEDNLHRALESSGFFGARFREAAGRSLLLTRQRFNQRLPLWMSRMQAKKLMTTTQKFTDFPVMLETWRSCLKDEFDLNGLHDLLSEIQSGEISWSLVTTNTPSPFAANVTFDQVSRYMYADDTPEQRERGALSDELIRNAVYDAKLRPRIQPHIITEFVNKRQRINLDYQPADVQEWQEWVKERILIPATELAETSFEAEDADLLAWVDQGERRWLAHKELLQGLMTSGLLPIDVILTNANTDNLIERYPEVEDVRSAELLAQEVLSFYGPLTQLEISTLLPDLPTTLLADSERFVQGQLIADDEQVYYCDAENFEQLLRFQRASQRPEVETKAIQRLPLFLIDWQHFNSTNNDNKLLDIAEQLRGYPGSTKAWLHDYLPPRLIDFSLHQLEKLNTEEQFSWLGLSQQKVTFCYPEDRPLLTTYTTDTVNDAVTDTPTPAAQALKPWFEDSQAKYSFDQIYDRSNLGRDEFNGCWWQAVWSGQLIADSLTPLEQGLARNYQLSEPTGQKRSARRRLRGFSKSWTGNWSLVSFAGDEEQDPITALEDAKERVRLLLDRYGFLCRELANREGGQMKWSRLFKALRVMELSGEVLAGYFFEQLSGPQFISPRALNKFNQHPRQQDQVAWMNATDPASPCGLAIDWPELPVRRDKNYLSFATAKKQGKLALVITNGGQKLDYYLSPEDEQFNSVTAPLVHLVALNRRVSVEQINGIAALKSPYLDGLSRILNQTRDHKGVTFEPKT